MINSNLRTGNAEHDAAIEASGIIPSSVALVAAAREAGLPIVWIRVERRADRTDVVDTLTDDFIAAGMVPKPPVTAGAFKAANVDELPVLEQDQVILKPRFDRSSHRPRPAPAQQRHRPILLGGYSTNIGVESCASTAKDRNYNVVQLMTARINVDVACSNGRCRKSAAFARVMTSREALTCSHSRTTSRRALLVPARPATFRGCPSHDSNERVRPPSPARGDRPPSRLAAFPEQTIPPTTSRGSHRCRTGERTSS